MCAINGFNWSDKDLIKKMNQCLIHRGPNGTGIFVDGPISLGHNRLSIIDIRDSANQPMKSNDERFVIIFNGEIYNYKEIKDELVYDYDFKTTSDTEVILAAYIKWGKGCVSHFNGMFAFAIWDTQEKNLFIARDPVGIKPLYYSFVDGRLIFSSEIKAILEHGMPRTLNQEAFMHYIRVLYVPEPHTMFVGIKKLAPCSTLFFNKGNIEIETYEQYKKDVTTTSQKSLRETIDIAVKRQLVSDRPLGVYLSGGIDSTVVLNSMSKVHKDILTFSVGFELETNEDFEKFNKDLLLARETSKLYGTHHHEIIVKKNEVIPLLNEAIYHLDEPISNPTVVPMLKLARYAREKVFVVLGGDGGDELFGGYERYRLSYIAEWYQKTPALVRKFLELFTSNLKKLAAEKGIEQFKLFMFQKEPQIDQAINKEFLKDSNISFKFFKEKYFKDVSKSGPELLMDVDLKSWLVDESLMRSDKISMATGLEQRVPLLDLEIIEAAQCIPVSKKVSFKSTKNILKNAVKSELPPYLFTQPKRGWFSPGAKWLRDPEILAIVRNVLSKEYYEPTSALFKWEEIHTMLDEHVSKNKYHFTILWAIVTFQIWAKRYAIQM